MQGNLEGHQDLCLRHSSEVSALRVCAADFTSAQKQASLLLRCYQSVHSNAVTHVICGNAVQARRGR